MTKKIKKSQFSNCVSLIFTSFLGFLFVGFFFLIHRQYKYRPAKTKKSMTSI